MKTCSSTLCVAGSGRNLGSRKSTVGMSTGGDPRGSPPATHPRSRAMLAAQASMAGQSRKSPSGARSAFKIMRSGNDILW